MLSTNLSSSPPLPGFGLDGVDALLRNGNCIMYRSIVEKTKLFLGYMNKGSAFDPFNNHLLNKFVYDIAQKDRPEV